VGPDESLGYIITAPDTLSSHTSPIGINAKIKFKRSQELTDESFLQLANHFVHEEGHDVTFTGATEASDWLNTSGYSCNYITQSMYDEETITYLSGLTTPLSYRQVLLIDRFIVKTKLDMGVNNLSDFADIMYIFGGETPESSLRNLISRSYDATVVNSPEFYPFQGFKCLYLNHINSNFNPAIHSTNFTLDHGSFGTYLMSSTYSGTNYKRSGCQSYNINNAAIQILLMKPNYCRSRYMVGLNCEQYYLANYEYVSGMLFANRISTNDLKMYMNGNQRLSTNYPTSIIPDQTIYFLCMHSVTGGGAFWCVDDICSFGFLGRGLTTTEIGYITNNLEEFLNARKMGVIP